MQLYFRPFFNILRQRNNFEWTTEHQKDMNTSQRTNFRYDSRSRQTFLCYVRRL